MTKLNVILCFLLLSCTQSPESASLYSITSKAKCKGPDREYHTELHATVDGYTRFHQSYLDSDPDYDAIIYGDTLGFTFAGDTIHRWTQSAEITVGIGHSFHMIAFDPKLVYRYSEGKYYDPVGNEVKFTFGTESNRVESFQIINPFDENEQIEVFFSKWENVQDINLPMQVHIIQGGKADFFFEFYEVKINDADFSKIPAS